MAARVFDRVYVGDFKAMLAVTKGQVTEVENILEKKRKTVEECENKLKAARRSRDLIKGQLQAFSVQKNDLEVLVLWEEGGPRDKRCQNVHKLDTKEMNTVMCNLGRLAEEVD